MPRKFQHKRRVIRLHSEQLEQRQLLAADTAILSLGEFATLDGSGNNLENPEYGSAGQPLLRIATAEYSDGTASPAGVDRPNPRDISNTLSADEGEISSRRLSAFAYVWGQFIDHDISRTPTGDESFSIEVPLGDAYFDPFNTGSATIPLKRSVAVDGESNEAREQVNVITTWLDGSMVYGSDGATGIALRTLEGGKLKTSDGDLLPVNNTDTFPEGTLPMDNDAGRVPDETLFAAGDARANENIELTSLHTLFVREHNLLADEIAEGNPELTDESIYQLARRKVIAQIQAITYNEWLPALLGERAIGRYEGYDAEVNPGIANEFSTAAFRFGHSMLGDDVEFLDNFGEEIAEEVPLSEAFSNPDLVSENGISSILKYLASDPSSELDTQVVDSVRNFLFGPPGAGGLDLVSLNIQRGRDHGLADYNDVREAYGLTPVTDFDEITSDPALAAQLESLYGSVDDIDLWVGGLAEDHAPGSSLGETFHTIVVEQFQRLRAADRFWYENVFSGRELREIRRTSLADILERNTQLSNLQDDVFFFDSSISGVVRTGSRRIAEDGLIVRLVTDSGEVVAETDVRSTGQFRFGVDDGLRTGVYQVQLLSAANESEILDSSNTLAVSSGGIHVRRIALSTASNDAGDDTDEQDREDEMKRRRRRPRR